MSKKTVCHHILYVVIGVEYGGIVPPVEVCHCSVDCTKDVPRCRSVISYSGAVHIYIQLTLHALCVPLHILATLTPADALNTKVRVADEIEVNL